MRTRYKEALIISISLLITIGIIFYYFTSLQEEKYMEDFNLRSLINPSSPVVLAINQPPLFQEIINKADITTPFASKTIANKLFYHADLVDISSACFVVVNPNSFVLLAKLKKREMRKLKRLISSDKKYAYQSVVEEKENITTYYYPEYGQTFWGYFYHKGILVMSTSRKLLNETANLIIEDRLYPTNNSVFGNDKVINHSVSDIYIKSDLLLSGIDSIGVERWKEMNEWTEFSLKSLDNQAVLQGEIPLSVTDSTLYQTVNDSVNNKIIPYINNLKCIETLWKEGNKVNFIYELP